MVYSDVITVPNALTLIRLICSPLMLPMVFAYLLPINSFVINFLLAILFLLFGGTDFLDGYLARKRDQASVLGSILDPIADKFLIYSALIGVMAAGKIYFYWVIILIGREFFIMGIRQLAAERGFLIPVSFWSKLKTVLQMMMLVYIIINPYQQTSLFEAFWWHCGEWILLLSTMILSLATAHWYYQEFIQRAGGYQELLKRKPTSS